MVVSYVLRYMFLAALRSRAEQRRTLLGGLFVRIQITRRKIDRLDLLIIVLGLELILFGLRYV